MKKLNNRPIFIGIVVVLLFALPYSMLAQSKKELEEKRKKIIRDIAATEKMIQKTKANKEATYDRFIALQNQIDSRESLIQTINYELVAAEEGIQRNQIVIASLERDVVHLKEEYGRTIRRAFRQKTINNPLLFILSAESLNQAFRRWLFIRKYDERRREQAKAIASTQAMLKSRTAVLQSTIQDKEQLLQSMEGQKASLSQELVEKNNILQFLAKDEVRLKTDLDKKQAAHEALNQAIERIISTEVQKRVDEARAKPAPAPAPAKPPAEKPNATATPKPEKKEAAPSESTPLPATTDALTGSFAKNRGRLPWPVESGFVSKTFGRQKHPTLKNIEITNNGIDIRTEENASVRAVFEGVVAGTQYIPGHDYTVILQHGDFYTVYSNLSQTSLNKGDSVKAKQPIGTVSTNSITGTTELHFELWQQKERLNPGLWIKR
ncbi:MAG: peptidoglycan DD-metalloendopeptidase family protein [Saprospiraceae bacterium]|nr:peptidoglycan DD-metalloendopeptidase family protein [Saprospiraceae bacterium]